MAASAPTRVLSTGVANDSLAALTGGKAEVVRPAAAPAPEAKAAPLIQPTAPAAAPGAASSGRGQGQLRLAHGSVACVIKALSLKEALLVVKRGESLPQVLESAVLDLEQGEGGEIARLNGYLHAVAAFEPKPDSDWLQLVPLRRSRSAEARLPVAPDRPRHRSTPLHARRLNAGQATVRRLVHATS